MEFRSGESGFGRLISSSRFLPIHLLEKTDNFDAVRELLGEVFAQEPFYSLVDLQAITGAKIGVGLFDSVQKGSLSSDVNRNRNDIELFRLLDCKFLIG